MLSPANFRQPLYLSFVLLGSSEWKQQDEVASAPAGAEATARAETNSPSIRPNVMRPGARFARAHCPKLEPLLEHDNLTIIVARILQV